MLTRGMKKAVRLAIMASLINAGRPPNNLHLMWRFGVDLRTVQRDWHDARAVARTLKKYQDI